MDFGDHPSTTPILGSHDPPAMAPVPPYPRPSILQTCWMKGLQSKAPGSPRAHRPSSSRFTAR